MDHSHGYSFQVDILEEFRIKKNHGRFIAQQSKYSTLVYSRYLVVALHGSFHKKGDPNIEAKKL